MKDFFSTKIGYQTIAFIVTIVSFVFLYVGGSQNISSVLIVGIILMLSSMLAVPAITFIHGKKAPIRDAYKGVSKLEPREE